VQLLACWKRGWLGGRAPLWIVLLPGTHVIE
jgi:hypothetical protein